MPGKVLGFCQALGLPTGSGSDYLANSSACCPAFHLPGGLGRISCQFFSFCQALGLPSGPGSYCLATAIVDATLSVCAQSLAVIAKIPQLGGPDFHAMLFAMSALRPSMDRLMKQSLLVSRALFIVLSLVFLLGVSLALILDIQNGYLPTIINTLLAFVAILTAFILGASGKTSRNLALGIMVYACGIAWIAETLVGNHPGTALPINFLSNLVILISLLAGGGFLVAKSISLALGIALLVYIVAVGAPLVASFPEIEYYLFFFVFNIAGLTFIVFYYRYQLEQVIIDLHSTRDALQLSLERPRTGPGQTRPGSGPKAGLVAAAGTEPVPKENVDASTKLGSHILGPVLAREIQLPIVSAQQEEKAVRGKLKSLKAHLVSGLSQDNYARELLAEIEESLDRINLQASYAGRLLADVLVQLPAEQNSAHQKLNALVQESTILTINGIVAMEPDFSCNLHYDFDERIHTLGIDKHGFLRVLVHSLYHAFSAVRERMAQEASSDYQAMVRVKTRKLDREIEIRVENNGLSAKDLPSIQADLSTARQLLEEEFGGSLDLEHVDHDLSSLIIRLPAGT